MDADAPYSSDSKVMNNGVMRPAWVRLIATTSLPIYPRFNLAIVNLDGQYDLNQHLVIDFPYEYVTLRGTFSSLPPLLYIRP